MMLMVIAFMSISAVAQVGSTTSPEPTPTPKPAVKRRGLDQFGLSSGVFSSGGSSSANANVSAGSEPVTKEYVDAGTFETIIVSIEKAEFMESELNRVLMANPGVDMSPGSAFTKYFLHHMVGLMHVSAVERTGTFGGPGIKSGQITALLVQNEDTVNDMAGIMNAGGNEYARYTRQLNAVNEKYGVPLLASARDGMLLDKPALLKAMMSRINSNYGRIKRIMAVRK